ARAVALGDDRAAGRGILAGLLLGQSIPARCDDTVRAIAWSLLLPADSRFRGLSLELFLPQSLRRERPSSVPLGWLLFGLVFWSVLVMKREVYLMPLFPAVAILVAERLDREATREDPQPRLAWTIAAGVLALVLLFLMWIFGFLSKLLSFDSVAGVVLTGALLLIVLLLGARTRERAGLPVAVHRGCGMTLTTIE